MLVAALVFAGSSARANNGVVFQIAPSCDQSLFVIQVLQWERSHSVNWSTEETPQQVFTAMDQDSIGILGEAELAIVDLDPGYQREDVRWNVE